MSTSRHKRCANCLHAGVVRENTATCRRYPPQYAGPSAGQAYWEQPTVSADGWCGEFAAQNGERS